jgi:IS1 family transposase
MKEHDYQEHLESLIQATHKRNLYGVTDITTGDAHIEIKRWSDYKTALGQLIAYNHGERKQDLYVYFFGLYPEHKKEQVVELFKEQGINVNELCINSKTWFNTKDEHITIFIRETLGKKQSSKVHCKDVWDSYNQWCKKRDIKPGKQKVLEQRIEETFNIEPKRRLKLNGIPNRGWIDIAFR